MEQHSFIHIGCFMYLLTNLGIIYDILPIPNTFIRFFAKSIFERILNFCINSSSFQKIKHCSCNFT